MVLLPIRDLDSLLFWSRSASQAQYRRLVFNCAEALMLPRPGELADWLTGYCNVRSLEEVFGVAGHPPGGGEERLDPAQDESRTDNESAGVDACFGPFSKRTKELLASLLMEAMQLELAVMPDLVHEAKASAWRSTVRPLKWPRNMDSALRAAGKVELTDVVERFRSGCGPARLESNLQGLEICDQTALKRALEADSASPAQAIVEFAARIEAVADDIRASAEARGEVSSVWLEPITGAVAIVFEELAAIVLMMALVEDRDQKTALSASVAPQESA